MRIFAFLSLLLSNSLLLAEGLPQPLSLGQAFDLALAHPSIQAADARLQQANARTDKLLAEDDFNLRFEGELTYVDPVKITPDRSNNDSKMFLKLDKKLYDFGYTDARLSAADRSQSSQQWQLYNATQQHLINVAELFFEVLLADKSYAVADEKMTVAYLRYDKTKERHDLGTVSDVDLLDLENDYRQKLQLRRRAEYQQRLSRMKLASAMGMPDQLPSDLVEPPVDWDKQLPTLNDVETAVLDNNAEIRALKESVEAARQQLSAAEASDNPVIRGEMQYADYQRLTGSSHPFMFGLVLEAPLYSGGKVQAEQSLARASLQEQEARLANARLLARQQALELVLDLEQYKTDIEASHLSEDFIELYLDRSRALYELEVASDLGDALSRSSEVIYQKLKARLGYALTEMKLAALQGNWQQTLDKKPITGNDGYETSKD
jgi:outer membrane protein TolC